MPQGRRKIPFSGKAKKEQLKLKRQVKSHRDSQNVPGHSKFNKKTILLKNSDDDEDDSMVQKLNFQPSKGGRNTNRYVLQFYRETDAELREHKEQARHILNTVEPKDLEINVEDYFPKELDFPKRPPWSFDMTREALEAKENQYFTEYIKNLEKQYNWKNLSFFELNLETWRQLWRVLEMSDIILFIVDIRFSALMFPPSLYEYVSKELNKNIILVLNKIDLAPAPLVAAWKHYFQQKYPEINIVMFTTLPEYNLIGNKTDKAGLQVRRRRGRLRMAAEGTQLLYEACKKIAGDEVDLSSWQQKIKEETTQEFDEDEEIEIGETIEQKKIDTGFFQHERYKGGVLTIGCVGQPNVGKSSLMNAIMGKKVVSVSKTPGHTKHFQTIYLTPNVKLCDCPGLVFPSKVPKSNQVLMGSFPIAQLREPFSTVKYLAERLDLPKLLRIEHPENDEEWSAMDVCDGWAKKRGYLTAKAARLDSYRAANSILRMALDGKICLCLYPPSYIEKIDYWKNHPDVATVKWIQARKSENPIETILSDVSEDEELTELLASGDHKSSSTSGKASNESSSSEEEDEEIHVDVNVNKFAALSDI